MSSNHPIAKDLKRIILWGTLIPYGWILERAIQQRTWSFYGVIDLFTLVFLLWMFWDYCGRPLKQQRKGWFLLEILIRSFLWGVPVFGLLAVSFNAYICAFFQGMIGTFIYLFPLGYIFVAEDYVVWLVLLLAFGLALILHIGLKVSIKYSILLIIFIFYGVEIYCGRQYLSGMNDHWVPPENAFLQVFPFSKVYQRSRQLLIDPQEEHAYASFQDTTDHEHSGGILQYNLLTHQTESFYSTPIGDQFVMSEDGDFLYFSSYLQQPQLLKISTKTFEVSPLSFAGQKKMVQLPDRTDAIDWISKNVLVLINERQQGDSGLFLIDLNREIPILLKFHPLKIPPYVMLNFALRAIPARKEGFSLISGNHKTYLLKFQLDRTVAIEKEWIGYSVEIYYSPVHQSLFIPFLDQNLMVEVTLDGLKTIEHKVPRGVRQIVDGPHHTLLLLDYLRKSLSIYDPRQQLLLKTVAAPPYSEGMAIGPKTGNLYIISSSHLWFYDLKNLWNTAGLIHDVK